MFEPMRVATLIANPDNPCLSQELANAACASIEATAVYSLADGIACDIPVPSEANAPAETLARVLREFPVDIIVQPQEDRRKLALLADMDSTLIRQECIDELADEAGVGEKVSAITARAMNGEVDFEEALIERVSLLKGLSTDVIDTVLASRTELTPGGRELVQTMKLNGAYCALVSGGFTHFTTAIAKRLGMDENRANSLHEENGHLTGRVIHPILGREAKVEALRDISSRRSIHTDDVMAVGDGANDLGMLALAGVGVSLHAKPVVAQQAAFRIDHGDLTALLYMQGYRKTDFVT